MKLTQEQFDFFKDLNVSEAVKYSEGQVQFTFPHRGRRVEVQPYSLGGADILVRNESVGSGSTQIDRSLSLFDIPGTKNVSGPVLLMRLHKAVHSRPAPLLREAWLNTPYVKQWPVDVLGSRIRFSYQDGPVTYELWAQEAPEIQETTVVELLVDGERVHTFLLPTRHPKQPSTQFLCELAHTVTEAWCVEAGGQAK